jgi:Protein of unknown function (DUF4242)
VLTAIESGSAAGEIVPIFVDRHLSSSVDPAVRRKMLLEVLQGTRDPSGALPIGHWVEDQVMYCLLDAPDVEAICRHHGARGLACDDVHPVEALAGIRPMSFQENQVVRAAIGQIWPHSAAHPKSVP